MIFKSLERKFVSNIDEFLNNFNQKNKPSASIEREQQKHQRLAQLRDNPDVAQDKDEIWEGF